jgi:hypothetical protein
MARFNEILVGRYNRYLQKLFSMKGEPPAPQLASEIQPSLTLQEGEESRYLQGWNVFARAQVTNAQGAAASGVRLRNPTGSNVIAVITKIVIGQGITSTDNLEYGAATTDLDVTGTGKSIDGRAILQSNCIISQSSAAGATALSDTIFQTAITANAGLLVDVLAYIEVPLLPGFAYQMRAAQNNTVLNTSWFWRERFLEDSERT